MRAIRYGAVCEFVHRGNPNVSQSAMRAIRYGAYKDFLNAIPFESQSAMRAIRYGVQVIFRKLLAEECRNPLCVQLDTEIEVLRLDPDEIVRRNPLCVQLDTE